MTASPYRIINWNPTDLIGEDKMDQLVNNVQWIYENTPRAVYTLPSGLRRIEGIRLAAGKVMITARKEDGAVASVTFTNLFSSGCYPIITTSLNTSGQNDIFHVINGRGSMLQPDHTGFDVLVRVASTVKANDRIYSNFYVNWMAMGY